jgi:hypothetical protein
MLQINVVDLNEIYILLHVKFLYGEKFKKKTEMHCNIFN